MNADIVVILDKTEFEERAEGAETVETALAYTMEGGRVGAFSVDPLSLRLGQ